MNKNDIVLIVLYSPVLGGAGSTERKGQDFDHARVEDFGLVVTYGDDEFGVPWHRVFSFA